MLSLHDLQSQLAAHLLDPGAEGAGAPVLRDAIPAQERIDFHGNSGISNFRGTLRAVYPVVERLVGANFFACAADAYRDADPSSGANLNLIGEHFADFVDTWTATGELPYLADIARLEWRIEQSFQAAERASLSIHDFAAVPPERHEKLKFELHPSCRLLASEWPIHHIWRANQPGAPVGLTMDLRRRDLYLLIRRQAHAVVIETLDRGEFCMLNLLATSSAFDDARRSAIATQPDFDLSAFCKSTWRPACSRNSAGGGMRRQRSRQGRRENPRVGGVTRRLTRSEPTPSPSPRPSPSRGEGVLKQIQEKTKGDRRSPHRTKAPSPLEGEGRGEGGESSPHKTKRGRWPPFAFPA